ncbi:MAG: lysylphosphatidylglycerol synthase transmembrane domain-containing protein [Bacteroidales bacterium]
MRKHILTILKTVLFLSIGFFFIWIFLRQLSPEQRQDILLSFRAADYFWVGITVFVGAGSHLIRAARWKLILKPLGYDPKLSNTFFAVMTGYLANLALPRLGEVTRCGILGKYEKIPVNKSFGTVIAERSVDMIVFLLLFFVNLFVFWDRLFDYVNAKVFSPLEEQLLAFSQNASKIWLAAIILAAGMTTVFVLHLFSRHARFYLKVKELARGFGEGFKSVLKLEKIGLFIFYTVVMWIFYFLMVYLCFFSLPETAHLGLAPGISVVVYGSVGLMVVQGGIGVYPAIVAETLLLYGVPSAKGYALGWITWSAQNIMIIIFAAVSLFVLPILNKNR